MATAETRAEALRALIGQAEEMFAAVQQGTVLHPDSIHRAGFMIDEIDAVTMRGSLDAVARLEAPLRERGLRGPFVRSPGGFPAAEWVTTWEPVPPNGKRFIPADIARAEAPTEAKARLLAVLRALLHECEVPHAQR